MNLIMKMGESDHDDRDAYTLEEEYEDGCYEGEDEEEYRYEDGNGDAYMRKNGCLRRSLRIRMSMRKITLGQWV